MKKTIEKKIKNLLLRSEKSLESRLIRAVKAKNGICIKIQGMGNKGMPDRMCLFPGGKIWFVELKRKGETPASLQLWAHLNLRVMGFKVRVISNEQELNQFENEISGT